MHWFIQNAEHVNLGIDLISCSPALHSHKRESGCDLFYLCPSLSSRSHWVETNFPFLCLLFTSEVSAVRGYPFRSLLLWCIYLHASNAFAFAIPVESLCPLILITIYPCTYKFLLASWCVVVRSLSSRSGIADNKTVIY